jgi:hypothetical protein
MNKPFEIGELNRDFWINYISCGCDLTQLETFDFEDEIYEREDNIVIEFPKGFSIQFKIEYGEHRIFLRKNHEEPIELGWMDSHQMSDVFSWGEFELIEQHLLKNFVEEDVIAYSNLLYYYVVPTIDCVDKLSSKQKSDLQKLGCFSDSECDYISNYIQRIARSNFQWYRADEILYAKGEKCYSLRTINNHNINHILIHEFVKALL